MTEPLLYDTHMHTPLCKHAQGEPEQYAAVAEKRGLKGVIFTCHNPLPDGISADVRMSVDEFDQYVDMVQRAADAFRGRVDVRLGLECDYFPGLEPWLTRQIESADLHYVLGSVHPFTRDYVRMFGHADPLANQITYFQHVAMAGETGLFDCLSHPDIIKIAQPDAWQIDRLMDCICQCLDRVAAAGTAMEFNTSGWHKVIAEANPGPQMLAEMAGRDIPVVVGSDSHVPGRVGDRFDQAFDCLEEAGYDQVSFFLDRTRRQIPIDLARGSLKPVDAATS